MSRFEKSLSSWVAPVVLTIAGGVGAYELNEIAVQHDQANKTQNVNMQPVDPTRIEFQIDENKARIYVALYGALGGFAMGMLWSLSDVSDREKPFKRG